MIHLLNKDILINLDKLSTEISIKGKIHKVKVVPEKLIKKENNIIILKNYKYKESSKNLYKRIKKERLTLKQYYDICIKDYESKHYTNIKINTDAPTEFDFHIEAQNYLMYEYWLDKKDNRINNTFNYIIKPNDTNNNINDIDFTEWTFDEFLDGLITLKN